MDISNIKFYDLVRELWKNQKVADFYDNFPSNIIPPASTDEEIEM